MTNGQFILRSGTAVSETLITAVIAKCEDLFTFGLGAERAIFELVELCKHKDYKLTSTSKAILQDVGLCDSRSFIADDVREIVLQSAIGSGLDMNFISPLAPRLHKQA